MSVRSAYNSWHQRVIESDPTHEDASSPWYQLVREALGVVSGVRALEVACGRCGFVAQLARDGAHVTGCDFSSVALALGRSRLRVAGLYARAAWLVQGDMQALTFAESSYDVVISCETIEHVPDPLAGLREMYRVARPGARLYLTTPNYFNLVGLYQLYSAIRHPGRKSSQPLDRRYLFPQVRKLVRSAGWEILETDGTVHQFPFVPARRPIQLDVLERSRRIRRLLSPLALHYLLIAQKPVAA